jgi:hypothetical protein
VIVAVIDRTLVRGIRRKYSQNVRVVCEHLRTADGTIIGCYELRSGRDGAISVKLFIFSHSQYFVRVHRTDEQLYATTNSKHRTVYLIYVYNAHCT